MAPLSNRRGSALLVAMIALAVLMIMVVGAITFTGSNREGAAAKARGDRVAACADTAKRYLLSRLRTFNVPVTGLVLNDTLPDTTDPNPSRLLTAHYGQTTGSPATIVAISAGQFGTSGSQVRDVANAAPASGILGGQYYRVVVKCRETATRESELEFVFRHGI
jgi:hypothetical protein